jgi:RNA polymerase sigma-70 factor, ECF subfamily
MKGIQDAGIVARIRTGDVAAFEEIFRTHFDLLFRVANSILRAPDVAEDVVCEVFADVYRRRESWEISTTIEAYLVRAVRYRALNAIRRTRRESARHSHLVSDRDYVVLAGEEPAADEALIQAEESATRGSLVRSAIEELSDEARTLITLRWERGMSISEIAEVLGTTEPAVRMRMTRIVHLLRQRVRGRP